MKIENNGLSPLSSKRPEAAQRVEKKEEASVRSVRGGQDRAEMSGNARLLARARVALGGSEDMNVDRVSALKSQIGNGDYTVQVGELARKLVARFSAQ